MTFEINYGHESQYGIGFRQWLPKEEDAIEVADGDLTIKGWLDRDCLQFGEKHLSDEEVSRRVNMHCNRVHIQGERTKLA